MKKFTAKFLLADRWYEMDFSAFTAYDVQQLILRQYPGVSAIQIRQKGN